MDEAVTQIKLAVVDLVGFTVVKTSGNDGLLFTGLNGGTITFPNSTDTIQNAEEVAIDVGIDSPHFVAEFVIIEKD